MSNRDETATLAAKEALGLAGSYHIAHAVMSASSTSKGLPMLVGAGCSTEARDAVREGFI